MSPSGDRRNLILEELQLGAGHVEDIGSRLGGYGAVVGNDIGRSAHDNLDGLAAHHAVAEYLRLRIGGNAVTLVDREFQTNAFRHVLVELHTRDRPDLHAVNQDVRGSLDAAHLLVIGVISVGVAEDLGALQELRRSPRRKQYGHREQPNFHFTFHIV